MGTLVYDLLVGSYDHILEAILQYLAGGPAIECCLHVSQAWHNYILRFSSWAEFVPHQKEIKYDHIQV